MKDENEDCVMKIVLVTNILTPYRKVFYDELFNQCKENGDEFHVVVMAETEPGRHWKYQDFETEYTSLLKGKLINIAGIYTIINWGTRKKIKEINPDIVIASGSYMITTVWQLIALSKILKYKILYWSESHDDEERHYSSLKMKVRENIRKCVLNRFDGFWFAGIKSKKLIIKYSKDNAQYIFVPNLVDHNKFGKIVSEQRKEEVRDQYNLEKNKKIFICPARLHPAKGILEFLDLYEQCRNKENSTILIVGDGELYEEIKKVVAEKCLDVRLLGYKSEAEMIELYAIADIFLLPSKSDPNPLSCIEACWQRLPLLVSEHVGNHPEIIAKGINGYVFSYKDLNKSVQLVDKMLEADETWLEQASEYSYQVAQEKYNPQKEVERILQQHREIIKG